MLYEVITVELADGGAEPADIVVANVDAAHLFVDLSEGDYFRAKHEVEIVITSYSIHYTKLYEPTLRSPAPLPERRPLRNPPPFPRSRSGPSAPPEGQRAAHGGQAHDARRFV